MSFQMIILTGGSLVGLLAISGYRFLAYKNLRSFIFQLIALGIISGLLYKFFYVSGSVVAKGDGASIYFVIILYVFMLLGTYGRLRLLCDRRIVDGPQNAVAVVYAWVKIIYIQS